MVPDSAPVVPETLSAALAYFADPEVALLFVAGLKWSDGRVRCPRCASRMACFLGTRRIWKCRQCAKQYSVKGGSIFEDSRIAMEKWLPVMWMLANRQVASSSHALARSLRVTQTIAWTMLQRLRLAMEDTENATIAALDSSRHSRLHADALVAIAANRTTVVTAVKTPPGHLLSIESLARLEALVLRILAAPRTRIRSARPKMSARRRQPVKTDSECHE